MPGRVGLCACVWVGVCVCVDTRSDSSSFRKKPRSPMCHNTSDSASCLALFLSPSFPVALDRFASLFLLYFSEGVLIDGNVRVIERENNRRTRLFFSFSRPSLIHHWIVLSPVSCAAEWTLCAWFDYSVSFSKFSHCSSTDSEANPGLVVWFHLELPM